MSDITKELTLPEPVELTTAELDQVCGGAHQYGATQAGDPDRPPDIVRTPHGTISIPDQH